MGSALRQAAWMARCVGQDDLSPFGPEDIDQLTGDLGVRQVAAGTPLMAEAKPIRSIGVILAGDVQLTRRKGHRRVVLQILHAGDVYGDIPFLCHMPPPFSARSLTPADVVEIDAVTFWRMLHTRPHLCQRFLFSVASRLQRMQQRLLEVTSGDLLCQVASLLLDETGGGEGVIPLTQATVAELLGATRSNVNRALKELQDRGAVRLAYRRIEVTDASRLTRLTR